jgi:hypothetical protein
LIALRNSLCLTTVDIQESAAPRFTNVQDSKRAQDSQHNHGINGTLTPQMQLCNGVNTGIKTMMTTQIVGISGAWRSCPDQQALQEDRGLAPEMLPATLLLWTPPN